MSVYFKKQRNDFIFVDYNTSVNITSNCSAIPITNLTTIKMIEITDNPRLVDSLNESYNQAYTYGLLHHICLHRTTLLQ